MQLVKRAVPMLLGIIFMIIPFTDVSAREAEDVLEIGDYITLGKYDGEDIVWRYVADDENGKLMLCDSVLCKKAFNDEGEDKKSTYSERYGIWAPSSRWSISSIRFWLNSEEAGFLSKSNFKYSEKNLIKPVSLNTGIDPIDYAVKTGGNEIERNAITIYYADDLSDEKTELYKSLAYETTNDKIFLIDMVQLSEIAQNSDVLYDDRDEIANELNIAALRSAYGGYDNYDMGAMDSGCYIHTMYIMPHRDYYEDKECEDYSWSFRISYTPCFVESKIRPAFYLNEDAVILSGDGTKEEPYVVTGEEKQKLKIGDYITLGKYDGEDIVWRYVADDENGKLFWSEENLDEKRFDETILENGGCSYQNYWETSSLKSWMNSEDYVEDEKGFLHGDNFTASEKTLIKTISLENIVDNYFLKDNAKSVDRSTVQNIYWNALISNQDIRDNFKNYPKETFVEKMFLLDYTQLAQIEENKILLHKTEEHIKKESFWLRTPFVGEIIDGGSINAGCYVFYGYLNEDASYGINFQRAAFENGIRPAFYLNEDAAVILSGSGTKEEPYVVTGMDAVEAICKMEIMEGCEDGAFREDESLTRAEAAAIMVRLINLEEDVEQGETGFSDVPKSHWASGYINVAEANGIINGLGDGTFCPEEKVTYHQMVKMVICALNYKYTASLKGGWENGGYIAAAKEIGLLKEDLEDLNTPITRGETARLCYKALDIELGKPYYGY